VVLKKLIKERWHDGCRHFTPPQLSDTAKSSILPSLVAGLSSPSSKLRTAFGMAVAAVFAVDDWPELIPQLVAMIERKEGPSQVQGAIRCLA
jgi:hypothetical protein